MTTTLAQRMFAARRNLQGSGAPERSADLKVNEFPIVRYDDYAVISVKSDLDVYSAKSLDKAILRTAVGYEGLVLDLRDCPACDSSSLAMMAKHRYVRKDRVRFVVAANGPVRKIFEITGLSSSMVLYATLEAALAALRGSSVTAAP